MIKKHRYQYYNVKNRNIRYDTFRFLIVDEYGSLIFLGDKKDFIYINPSAAAMAATGNLSEGGWRFFDID